MYYVYSVTCTENGRYLMGVTKDFKRMKTQILYRLKQCDARQVNLFLLGDYIKWGRESIEFEIWGEFEGEEEAKIWAWLFTLKEMRTEDRNIPNEWVIDELCYNRKGFNLKASKISAEGLEIIIEYTGMAIQENGKVIVDVELGRRSKYDNRKRLKDRRIMKTYRRRRF